MTHRFVRPSIVVCALGVLFTSTIAEAQWALIARRAIGRVEQMSQQSTPSGGASYDSAAVIIDAPAEKVYAAVMRGLANNTQGVKVTTENAQSRVVEFSNGQQTAGIKVVALSDDLSQLFISSAHQGDQKDAATLVMNSVLRVCAEMKVECSRAQQ